MNRVETSAVPPHYSAECRMIRARVVRKGDEILRIAPHALLVAPVEQVVADGAIPRVPIGNPCLDDRDRGAVCLIKKRNCREKNLRHPTI